MKRIFSFFAFLVALFTSVFSGADSIHFAARDAENIRLNFAAISDLHMKDGWFRSYGLGLGLEDLKNSETKVDALVVSGDLTDHGYEEQYDNLANTFEKYNTVENVILAIGNHDTWVESDLGADSVARFCEANKRISNIDSSTPYYSTLVNGYSFIVIGSEDTLSEKMVISDTQLAWLRAEMDKAAQSDKPIFVVSHNAFNGTHGLPGTWGDDEPKDDDGGIGDQSDAVEAILKAYENVFFINGHIHIGFGDELTEKLYGYKSIESEGSFHSINLPCYMYMNFKGYPSSGTGFQFEVYDTNVIIRGRNYQTGSWCTNYEYNIPLV